MQVRAIHKGPTHHPLLTAQWHNPGCRAHSGLHLACRDYVGAGGVRKESSQWHFQRVLTGHTMV